MSENYGWYATLVRLAKSGISGSYAIKDAERLGLYEAFTYLSYENEVSDYEGEYHKVIIGK